jgi:hypothetical protein
MHTTLPAKDTYHVPTQYLLGKMHDLLYELPPGTEPIQQITNEHVFYYVYHTNTEDKVGK